MKEKHKQDKRRYYQTNKERADLIDKENSDKRD